MLSKSSRLDDYLVNLVRRKGKNLASSIYIKGLPSKDGSFRVSVIVPKTIYKSAVKRNKLRRRVYAAIRMTFSKPKYLLIIYPGQKEMDAKFTDLIATFESIFNKINT